MTYHSLLKEGDYAILQIEEEVGKFDEGGNCYFFKKTPSPKEGGCRHQFLYGRCLHCGEPEDPNNPNHWG